MLCSWGRSVQFSWGKKEWRHASLLRRIGLRVRTSRPCPTLSGVRDAGRHPVFWTLSPGYLTMTDMEMVCMHGRNSGPLSLAFFPVPRPRFWGTEPKQMADAPLSGRHVYSCTPDKLMAGPD